MMEPVVFDQEPIDLPKPWALTGTGGVRPHNTITSIYIKADVLEAFNQNFRPNMLRFLAGKSGPSA